MRYVLLLTASLVILATSADQAQATDPYQWVGFTTRSPS